MVVGERFAKRYDIVAPLGDGTHGHVWHAHDINVNREVALKELNDAVNAVAAYQEAATLELLTGDYTLQVYDATTYGDVPYITTAIAPHGSTEDRLEETPSGIRPDVAVRWVRQALVGLGSAHARRLIHRDVKPANIFLKALDHAALGDFGITHRADINGQVPFAGDPLVRPPEMIRGRPGDVRSDVYSMGVTLYRLLTKKWPFEDPDWANLRAAVTSGRCEPVWDLAPHLPPRLARIVSTAMAVDAADRFETWDAMDSELGKVTYRRNWSRVATHLGHDRCWAETPGPRRPVHEVCVIPRQRRLDIVVKLMSRRGPLKNHRLSSEGWRPSELSRRLRSAFRSA